MQVIAFGGPGPAFGLGQIALGQGGGVTPLGPTTVTISAGATHGTLIAAITGLSAGEEISTVAPNDGRLALDGSRRNLIVGLATMTAGSIAASLTTSAGRVLAMDIVVEPYSRADKYNFAAVGFRWPNKVGGLGAGYTKLGNRLSDFRSAPWEIPAGSTLIVAYANHRNIEGDFNENERLIPNDATIEAVGVTYLDANSVSRTASATEFTNSGVLSSTVANGGVLALIPLTYAIPAGRALSVAQAFSVADAGSLLSCYDNRGSDTCRRHASTSFASVVNSGGNIAISGSAAYSINGNYPGPAFIAAFGADGRPIFYLDGDSIMYGKGTPEAIGPQHTAGIAEPALISTSNGGYVIPCCNGTIAGSGYHVTDPENANYNPDIHAYRRALVDQVTTLNGGTAPFSHYLVNHLTNSIQVNAADQIALSKTRYDWLQAWHNKPVIQLTALPKATSTDGFRTTANQTPNDTLTRTGFNDALLSNRLDGRVVFGVDTASALYVGAGSLSDRSKFSMRPFTANLTRDIAASATVLYLNASPEIGAALCVDPLSGSGVIRVVTAVSVVTPDVEWMITTTAGASSGNYPAKTAGTLVGESWTSDGNPATLGLHVSKLANDAVAAKTGTNSFQAMKASLKAAVGGGWD